MIESFAIINIHGVSTKPNYYCIRHANIQGTYYSQSVVVVLEACGTQLNL